MVFLQTSYLQTRGFQCPDCADGCRCGGKRGDQRNFVTDGRAADFLSIGIRLTPKRGVDDDLDLTCRDGIHDMRGAFGNFIDPFDIESYFLQPFCG